MAGKTEAFSLARSAHLLAAGEDPSVLPAAHRALLEAATARRAAADVTEGLLREDVLRARLAVWLGLVEPPAATKALREQATRLEAGSIARVADLFVQQGQLTLPQAARVEQCLSALPSACGHCGAAVERFLTALVPGYACPSCGQHVPSPIAGLQGTPSPGSLGTRFPTGTPSPSTQDDRTEQYGRVVVPMPGRPFGKYLIECELGRGGMGVVYKAVQQGIDRVVALKTLIAGPNAPEPIVKRFLREAASCAHLSHPNIVTIHDVGTEQGVHYFTMEYIQGQTLSQLLKKRKRLPPDEACRLLGDVARAVHYAHGKGVIHRDLKPSNILIDDAGHPHVMDFGLAKQVEGQGDLTLSGTTIGTPAYMSPEQAGGTKQEVDSRSDVYSLGAILFECLTGEKVFQGETEVQVIFKVVFEPARPLRSVNPDAPIELEAVVAKALAKEREKRYPSAWELAQALESFKGVPAKASRIVEPPPPPPPGLRYKIELVVVVMMLLAGAGVVAWRIKPTKGVPAITTTVQARALLDKSALRPPEEAILIIDQALALDPYLAEGYYQRAKAEQSLGKNDEALADFTKAIQKNSAYLQAYLGRALLLDRTLGRPDEAKRDYEMMLQIDPQGPTGHLVTGISLYQQGKYQKALPYLTKAVQLNEREDSALYYLVWAQIGLGQYDEAAQTATKAMVVFPNNELYLNLRGLTFCHRHRLKEAQQDFEASLSLNPSNADTWNNLGLVAQDRGDAKEALSCFGKAVSLAPNSALYRVNRGELLMHQEQAQEALADIQKAVSLTPNDSHCHLLLGGVLMGLSKPKEALAEFNEAVRLNPRSGPALWNRATAQAVKMDLASVGTAVKDWERAAAVDPRDTQTRTMFEFSQWLKTNGFQLMLTPAGGPQETPRQKAVARLRTELPKVIDRLSRSRLPTQAVQYLDGVTAEDEGFADGYFLKGICWALGGMYDEARGEFEKAAKLNARMLPAKGMLASLLYAKGDPAKAAAQYAEAAQAEGAPPAYRFLQAVCELDAGDKAKARADLQAVKDAAPDWPWIDEWLASAAE